MAGLLQIVKGCKWSALGCLGIHAGTSQRLCLIYNNDIDSNNNNKILKIEDDTKLIREWATVDDKLCCSQGQSCKTKATALYAEATTLEVKAEDQDPQGQGHSSQSRDQGQENDFLSSRPN